MKAYIISIGDEILIGQIINTNAAWIARQLNSIGIMVERILSVADTKEAIEKALAESMQHSNVVLITGGLGPTSDDITKPVLYKFFDSKPLFHQPTYEHVETLLKVRGVGMNELNRQQAIIADNCEIINNVCGTAPGMWFEKENTIFVAMPGVPFEMEKMMEEIILPKITQKYSLPAIVHRTIMTTGIAESTLALLIEQWEKQLPAHIRLAYLPSPGIVKLRLSATDKDKAGIEKEIEQQIMLLKQIAGKYIFSEQEQSIDFVVAELLKKKKQTLSLAESCTGGSIAQILTSKEGSSAYFMGGVVAYSNQVKIEQLNVPKAIIEQHGAVSQATVEAMATNARKIFKTDYSIAVSGIAGPSGGTPEKPVGTVWIAVAHPHGVVSQLFTTGEHRGRNITRAVINALNMLYKLVIQA